MGSLKDVSNNVAWHLMTNHCATNFTSHDWFQPRLLWVTDMYFTFWGFSKTVGVKVAPRVAFHDFCQVEPKGSHKLLYVGIFQQMYCLKFERFQLSND